MLKVKHLLFCFFSRSSGLRNIQALIYFAKKFLNMEHVRTRSVTLKQSPSILCLQHLELQLNFTEIQLNKVLITCTKGQISALCSDMNLVKQSSVSGYKIISFLRHKSKTKRVRFRFFAQIKSGANAHS